MPSDSNYNWYIHNVGIGTENNGAYMCRVNFVDGKNLRAQIENKTTSAVTVTLNLEWLGIHK